MKKVYKTPKKITNHPAVEDAGCQQRPVGHLRYDMYKAPRGHPQKVMKELGITYQHATPQTLGDQWWFWNCQNIPEELPPFIEVADWDPMNCIGWGLNKENAEAIRDFIPTQS